MKRRILIPITIGLLFVGIAAGANALEADPRLAGCGVEGNTVATSFEMSAASDIWKHFPEMGLSPELAANDKPAFVVVFEGDYVAYFGGAYDPDEPERPLAHVLKDVICVVPENADPIIYADVSRTGFSAESS